MNCDPHADAVVLGDWEHARPEGGLWWGGAFVASQESPALDKQVVHVKGKHFTALANSVDMREFDKALAILGIELVIDDTTSPGPAPAEPGRYDDSMGDLGAKVKAMWDDMKDEAEEGKLRFQVAGRIAERHMLRQADDTCRAEHPTNATAVPCRLPSGHGGEHVSSTGCSGSVMRWQPSPEMREVPLSEVRCGDTITVSAIVTQNRAGGIVEAADAGVTIRVHPPHVEGRVTVTRPAVPLPDDCGAIGKATVRGEPGVMVVRSGQMREPVWFCPGAIVPESAWAASSEVSDFVRVPHALDLREGN